MHQDNERSAMYRITLQCKFLVMGMHSDITLWGHPSMKRLMERSYLDQYIKGAC